MKDNDVRRAENIVGRAGSNRASTHVKNSLATRRSQRWRDNRWRWRKERWNASEGPRVSARTSVNSMQSPQTIPLGDRAVLPLKMSAAAAGPAGGGRAAWRSRCSESHGRRREVHPAAASSESRNRVAEKMPGRGGPRQESQLASGWSWGGMGVEENARKERSQWHLRPCYPLDSCHHCYRLLN